MGDRALSLFEPEPVAAKPTSGAPVPMSDIDAALTAQLIVGWAGESGESGDTGGSDEGPRLGWWRTDLASTFGGHDLFKQLLPHTWEWAALQGAREAARRTDTLLRGQLSDPDQVLSLFSLGFEIDERIEERLQDLKRSGGTPADSLPEVRHVVSKQWDPSLFSDWVAGHGEVTHEGALIGRRLRGAPPAGLTEIVEKLVAGLAPVGDSYPLPHFRRSR